MTGDAVIDFLRSAELELPPDVGVDTPMLTSGLVDSLRLFALLEWIEAQLGDRVDVLTLDLPADWETPRAVAAFVDRRRG